MSALIRLCDVVLDESVIFSVKYVSIKNSGNLRTELRDWETFDVTALSLLQDGRPFSCDDLCRFVITLVPCDHNSRSPLLTNSYMKHLDV